MELLQDFTPTCDLSTFTHPKVSVPSLGWMHPAGVSTSEHWGVCMCEPTQKLSAVLGDQLAQLAQLAQSLAAFYTLFAGQCVPKSIEIIQLTYLWDAFMM